MSRSKRGIMIHRQVKRNETPRYPTITEIQMDLQSVKYPDIFLEILKLFFCFLKIPSKFQWEKEFLTS